MIIRILQCSHGSLRAAVLRPEGQANGDHGPRIRIGVTIERYVQALVAGVIDQPQVVQMATDALGALPVVRQVDGTATCIRPMSSASSQGASKPLARRLARVWVW